MKKTIDPIRFEVIRNAFTEATEEMSAALKRSAFSTNIKTRCDFSCSFFDYNLRPIAQAFGQPNHLGSMGSDCSVRSNPVLDGEYTRRRRNNDQSPLFWRSSSQ